MSNKQAASTVMMIRPVDFSFNDQTAASNAFQNAAHGYTEETIKKNAEQEFDNFVLLLKHHGIDVIIFNDTPQPATPDSIFPNNWISLDQHGRLALYPMHAINRRHERRDDIVEYFKENFIVKDVYDLSYFEKDDKFLEGTGSMVIDYVNNILYACLSPRTDKTVIDDFCKKMNYTACTFNSADENGKAIYHTNVMMCIGAKLAVVCLESITDAAERKKVSASLERTGHEIIAINYEQMNHFAGNMLELNNKNGDRFLIMSAQAVASLTDDQFGLINKYNQILSPTITTIETIGGGGVRCMMAEVFLEKKDQ